MRRLLIASLLASTAAAGPHRVEVGFSVLTNAGLGRCAAVVGNQPELGNWNPAQSVRLTWHAGNMWSGAVSLSAGAAVEYKFISRDEASGLHCDSNNVHWAGGANFITNLTAPPAAPYAGKTLFYLSGFTSAVLLHASAGGAFTSTPMARVGDGRFPGESLYRVDGVGTAGEALQFVLWDGGTNYDHAPYAGYGAGPDYFTTLDVTWLQDGQLYNYRPAASVSPPRITETNVASSFAGIPGRRIRIYLPRGYDDHPWKRYPVLYLHDGNNLFSTNCDMCSWQADLTATREISQGRMREAILVGVDNSTNRILEYLPPPDVYSGQPGVADQFANFLIHNVRPTVDFHFRTLNQPSHTLTLGSSMGGVLAAYLGFETNVFGGAGVMSPAFWTAPLLVGRMASNAVRGPRVYLDFGTAESDASMWTPGWGAYGLLLDDGYAVGGDLLHAVGCGQPHNEAAWADRLPGALRFLLDVWDEPNRLALETYPPQVGGTLQPAAGRWDLSHTALRGVHHELQQGGIGEPGGWASVADLGTGRLPWAWAQVAVSNLDFPGISGAFRLVGRAAE